MKKLLTLAVMAAATLAGTAPAVAQAQGRTVAVLRNRPAAINPAPRAIVTSSVRYRSPQYFSNRSMGNRGWNNGGFNNLAWRHFSGGFHGRFLRNGYVGGLENIPDIVIQIPERFGRPLFPMTSGLRNRGHNHGGSHFGGRPGGNWGGGRPGGMNNGGGGGRPGGGNGGGGGGRGR
jgi:hypothetical protein